MILAGTGHRPNKLGLDYSEKSNKILREFCTIILCKITVEYDLSGIISGGSTGYDMALAESSIDLGHAVTLALPFHGFGSQWPESGQKRLWRLMERSTTVYTDEQEYVGPWQYAKRDKYLVDQGEHLLALYDGNPKSGTGITVSYANKQGKPITNVWDDWLLYKTSLENLPNQGNPY